MSRLIHLRISKCLAPMIAYLFIHSSPSIHPFIHSLDELCVPHMGKEMINGNHSHLEVTETDR